MIAARRCQKDVPSLLLGGVRVAYKHRAASTVGAGFGIAFASAYEADAVLVREVI